MSGLHEQPDRSQVRQKVIALAADQAAADPATLTEQTRFVADLEFDSLDAIDFVMQVEDVLGVRIPEDQVEHLQTVGQVIDYVLQHPPQDRPKEEPPPQTNPAA